MAIISLKNKTKSRSLLAGNEAFDPGSYQSIATVIVGSGGQATITFSDIPSTYKHLQIRSFAKWNSGSADFRAGLMRFNGDSGANYSAHLLSGDSSSAGAAGVSNYSSAYWTGHYYGANGAYTADIIDILDYASTSKYKTSRSLAGYDANGAGRIDYSSGLWMSTSAITSVTITISSDTFAQYSHFALYGIKG